ncbi:MAG: TrmH family RNA methyltransferase [Pseudomonadota bacterium]
MRLVLYQPDIPQNTGTILRLAACFDVSVDLIGPAGFDVSDRAFRRAGMDYLASVQLHRHISWAAFHRGLATRADTRLVLLTTQADMRHTDFAFAPSDMLLLGRESSGVPDDIHAVADARVRIPIAPNARSLNVAVAAGIVVAEALRQTEGWPDEHTPQAQDGGDGT